MNRLGWVLLPVLLLASLSALSQEPNVPNTVPSPQPAAPQFPPPVGPERKPSEDSVEKALHYAKNSQFDLAYPIFKRLAEQGNAEAQHHLGIMYYFGEGMRPDFKKAFDWRMRAAKSGHAGAQVDIGVMYYKGQGTKISKKEAARWFKAAAEQGYASGQRNLGLSYLDGDGVPKNVKLGLSLLVKATQQGDERSFLDLAHIHDRGKGVKRDQREAFRWYAKGAVNGNLTAQLELAKRYFDGRGVEKNIIKARTWARILGGDGPVDSLITFNRGEISVGKQSTSIRVPALQIAEKAEKTMSPAQIELSEALRKACTEEEDPERSIAACGLN